MNQKTDNSIIIFRDKPASASRYFFCVVIFLFFAIAAVWLVGMITEFYIWNTDFIVGISVAAVLMFLFGWIFVRMMQGIIGIERGIPLIKVSSDGVSLFGDRLKRWEEIRMIQLVTEFDKKHIAVS